MEKIISFGYGDAIGRFKKGVSKQFEKTSPFVYAIFFSPSYCDENVYFPAESVHITLDKQRLIEMRDIMDEFIKDMGE